jgi:hypothetical protein
MGVTSTDMFSLYDNENCSTTIRIVARRVARDMRVHVKR